MSSLLSTIACKYIFYGDHFANSLESIFSAFSGLLKRMVKDHLTGGKYDIKLTDDIVKETATVQKSNTISERDFAQLERLLRENQL